LGKGCYFDGVDDYINLSKNLNNAFNNTLSISMWVKPLTFNPRSEAVILDNRGSGGFGLIVDKPINNNYFKMENSSGGESVVISSGLIENAWNNLVIVYNNQMVSTYLNGNLIQGPVVATNVNGLGWRPNSIKIGRHVTLYDYYYKGSIDELYFYNRALSETEIKDLASL
jgi:hypothetical protein